MVQGYGGLPLKTEHRNGGSQAGDPQVMAGLFLQMRLVNWMISGGVSILRNNKMIQTDGIDCDCYSENRGENLPCIGCFISMTQGFVSL